MPETADPRTRRRQGGASAESRWDSISQRQRVISVTDPAQARESMRQARDRASSVWSSLDGTGRPESGWAYYVILACVIFLTATGLTMVLSASAVESISKDMSPISLFTKQAVWAAVGFVLMFGLSRVPVAFLRKLAWLGYFVAIVLLVLVLSPLGVEVNGNRNWLSLGPLSMQPSEPAKLALALWTAFILERKQRHLGDWRQTALPVFGLGAVVILLVLLGHDLGTSMILGFVLLTALWASGVQKRSVGFTVGAVGVIGVIMAVTSSNRSDRIQAWLGHGCDTSGLCDQAQAGLTALARGSWFGVGLGQSQVKWSWLPEAHNDFVFAIIGEELGFVGTAVIVAAFAVLTLVSLRVVLRYDDVFIRVAGSCIIVWIALQAMVNIAMVLGLIPVIGIPLPFISYGGSALTFTLAAMGILLSFARHRRGARRRTERTSRP